MTGSEDGASIDGLSWARFKIVCFRRWYRSGGQPRWIDDFRGKEADQLLAYVHFVHDPAGGSGERLCVGRLTVPRWLMCCRSQSQRSFMTAIPLLALLGFASGFSDRLFGQVLSGFITGAEKFFEEEGRRWLGGMTSKFRVIVLIGQVASGKTAVARELARQRTVRVTGIEQLQATRSDTSPAGIARELRALTGLRNHCVRVFRSPRGFRRDAVRDRSERGGTVRRATGGEFRDCVAPAAGARPA